jgi:hypothetical protein
MTIRALVTSQQRRDREIKHGSIGVGPLICRNLENIFEIALISRDSHSNIYFTNKHFLRKGVHFLDYFLKAHSVQERLISRVPLYL